MKVKSGSPEVLLDNLFVKWKQQPLASMEALPESGSYRKYFRMSGSDGRSVIGVFNEDDKENRAFVYLDNHLLQAGIRVPEVYATDLEKGIYLEEDLGDKTLLDRLAEMPSAGERSHLLAGLYRRIIDIMPDLQVKAFKGLDFSKCYPRKEFDSQSITWDLNYFKYNLLKPLKVRFYEQDLEDDFAVINGFLCDAPRESFMFRDLQSRNIMIYQDEICFIDFQGGRQGPLQYDLASLLFEAKARLGPDTREAMLDHYLSVFSHQFTWFRHKDFLKYFYGFVYLRLMQAMGAYGFRGLVEHKPVFLQSLPLALDQLRWLREKRPFPVRLRCLPDVFDQLCNKREISDYAQATDALTVIVRSFAYKQGIPADYSGNGGGFVFDCRALNNPGRIEGLRQFTGLDAPVIEFLSSNDDAATFLSHACQMTGQAVETYIKREFRNLTVGFGCTGGRHRSVFMAEKLAAYLKNKYRVKVVIHHTELERISDRHETLQNK